MKFQFPQEIKDVLGALADDTRWNILEAIINSDNKMAYSEIKKTLNVSDDKKGTLNYHLKELQKSGWIRNRIEDKEGTRNKSFYSLSKFAQKVMDGALQAMDRRSYTQKEVSHFANQEDITNYIQNAFVEIHNKVDAVYPHVEMEIIHEGQTKEMEDPFAYGPRFEYSRKPWRSIHEIRRHVGEVNAMMSSKERAKKLIEEVESVGKDRVRIAPIKRTRMKVNQT